MLEQLRKEAVIDHAQQILTQQTVLDAQIVTTMENEEGEVTIWLAETDNGEEYWIMEGSEPLHMFRKSGIQNTPQRVYETYMALLDEANAREELPDRFHQGM